jgi:hypothetical protein
MSKLNIRNNLRIIPVTVNNKSITNGSIVLQFGCIDLVKYNDENHRDKVKIFLQLKDRQYKEFSEDLLQKLAVTIQLVSGFILGPKTVVEIYDDPFLNDIVDVIINDTDNKLVLFDKKCNSDELQIDHSFRKNGQFIRSVKIWNYDYYMNNKAIRYCKSDFQCGLSEYCVCPNENYNGDFCPLEKKRCVPVSEYSDQLERNMVPSDIVNQTCFIEHANKYRKYWGTRTIPFGDIQKISAYCSNKEIINEHPQDLSLSYYFKTDNVKPKFINRDGYFVSREYFDGNDKYKYKKYIYIITTICIIVMLIQFFKCNN